MWANFIQYRTRVRALQIAAQCELLFWTYIIAVARDNLAMDEMVRPTGSAPAVSGFANRCDSNYHHERKLVQHVGIAPTILAGRNRA